MKPSCYLAGPITGLSYGAARHGWREEFFNLLGGYESLIACFSPMRQKEFLKDQQCVSGTAAELDAMEHALARPLGILTRDFNDVTHRDAMVACFLGATRVSIGTVWEIGVAFASRKPVVVVMEPSNIHNHVFITHSSGYVVPTLEEAALIISSLLLPGI